MLVKKQWVGKTRWWRSRWTWSTYLSLDALRIYLQMQKISQSTSWVLAAVLDNQRGIYCCCCCFSVAKSCLTHCHTMDCSTPCSSALHYLPEFAQMSSLSQWHYPTISSSVVSFSFCLQPFQASGSFPMNQLFASGGQSTGASASVLPMGIQGWFPLGWTSFIPFQYKGFLRVFSNTTIQKHWFFGTHPSLRSNSHSHTDPCQQSDVSVF